MYCSICDGQCEIFSDLFTITARLMLDPSLLKMTEIRAKVLQFIRDVCWQMKNRAAACDIRLAAKGKSIQLR